jgi:hypothetical protein
LALTQIVLQPGASTGEANRCQQAALCFAVTLPVVAALIELSHLVIIVRYNNNF